MRIRAIELSRAQRGWVCDVFFTVQTLQQFTPEEMAIRSGGRWILTAIWNGLREAKRKASSEEATPDEIKKRGWGAVSFCFMLLSGCCAVAQAGVQLQPEAIEITLPNIAGPPAPCPDPLVQPTPTITPDTIFVVQSNVPLIALQSPSGLLKITTDTGPLKIRGRFADGDGKIETRNYSAKYLVFVDAEKQGQTELIIVPHGCTKESDIVRQLLVVSGEGPRPPPGPGPDPKPPEPKPPDPVKSFRVIFVKESGSTLPPGQTSIPGAKVIREYLNAKVTKENGVPDWREYDRDQNTTNEHSGLKAIWDAVKPKIDTVPALVVEVNGAATVMPYPSDVDAAMKILTDAGGK